MKKNFSYTYLLPLLGEQVYFDRNILQYIKNTYLFSTRYVMGCYFFVLCSFNYNDPNFSKMESRMISSELFIESHDIGKDTLYVYMFPEKYHEDYDNFIKGLYSRFSSDGKKTILSFWTTLYGTVPSFVVGPLLKIKHVLYKDKILKEKLEEQLSSKGNRIIIGDNAELGNKIQLHEEQFIFPEDEVKHLNDIKKIFDI
jgi:hypothetical protein